MALIDKASLLFVPSVVAQEKAFNILPSGNRAPDSTDQNSGYDQTRADFTFDRGTDHGATRIGSDGLIKKYRENLLLQSNQFDTWSITSGSSVASGQSGYDGSSDAWLLTDSGASTAYCIYRSYTNTGVQTFSIYAKQASTSQIEFDFLNGGGGYLRAELTDGSLHSTLNTIDYKIENAGNGWWRCSFSTNHTSAPILVRIGCNGAGSIYLQNAQVENGLVATDYLDSGATTAKAGVLIDLPRINYDANGENGSLLLEPSRRQLIQYSEYFDVWTKVDTTLTHNYGTSPEGVKNSTRVQFSDSTAYMYIAPGGTSSGTYASSIYIKGTAGETIKFGKGGNVASGAMHTLNGDWQRIEHITTDVGLSVHISNYGGSTARDIEIYGCQLESGSYKSSYIPNHGESGGVTRAADSCSVTGVSDVIGQTEGTIYCEFIRTKTNDTYSPVIVLMENSTSELIEVYAAPNSNTFGVVIIDGGVNQFSKSFTAQEGINKFALAYKQNDCALYHNGVQIGTDTSATIPKLTQMTLGRFTYTSNFQLGDSIKQATLFKERLTNAELATLTTL